MSRCEPVIRELDLVPLELESAAERLAHRPFVVHDQDLHGSIVRIESEKSLRARTLREFLGAFQVGLRRRWSHGGQRIPKGLK